ncbi:hypothetical protein AN958_02058, partial [Leucoagaricus sp. SymC.cos]
IDFIFARHKLSTNRRGDLVSYSEELAAEICRETMETGGRVNQSIYKFTVIHNLQKLISSYFNVQENYVSELQLLTPMNKVYCRMPTHGFHEYALTVQEVQFLPNYTLQGDSGALESIFEDDLPTEDQAKEEVFDGKALKELFQGHSKDESSKQYCDQLLAQKQILAIINDTLTPYNGKTDQLSNPSAPTNNLLQSTTKHSARFTLEDTDDLDEDSHEENDQPCIISPMSLNPYVNVAHCCEYRHKFNDRVGYKYMHNEDIYIKGSLSIPDQGIEFKGTKLYQQTGYDPESACTTDLKGKTPIHGSATLAWQLLVDRLPLVTPVKSQVKTNLLVFTPINSNLSRKKWGYFLISEPPIQVASPGIANMINVHNFLMHERLCSIVQEYLSQLFDFPMDFKPSNNKLPSDKTIKPYKESSEFNNLENFVSAICIDLALKGMGGSGQGRDCL